MSGVDFLKHLSPEARARVESQRKAHERDVAEVRALSDEELCERTEYYLKNCDFPHRYQPGEPVYDGAMAHVVIPELLRRVRSGVTDAMVEKAARAVERFNTEQYGWTDEQFETWWNQDPVFVEQIHHWGNFRGTKKQHLLHKTRIALEAALL